MTTTQRSVTYCRECGCELEPPHTWCWDCLKAEAERLRIEASKPKPKSPKVPSEYVVTTSEVRANYKLQAERLSKCRMQAGSYEKRFVRDIASIPIDQPLTNRQMDYIDDLLWKYRKQLAAQKR